MPPNPRAHASWNYRRERGEVNSAAVSVTYDMNRLQGLKALRRYLVTLNPRVEPKPGSVVREFMYLHPAYTKPRPSVNNINPNTSFPVLESKDFIIIFIIDTSFQN